MLCKIADLLVEVPAAGGLDSRCREYLWSCADSPDILICQDAYRPERYDPRLGENTVAYMESAYQFYLNLVNFQGFYLHSSAVVLDGKAYLFSGPCRVGKSTHARQWQTAFGTDVQIINDDKPAIRLIDGRWYAYGTPWCGKDGINKNIKAPLAGVCFLKKAAQNRIRKIDPVEAMQKILCQTIYKFDSVDQLDKLLMLLNQFLQEIPVYELENLPEPAAAHMSFETMRCGAEEVGI